MRHLKIRLFLALLTASAVQAETVPCEGKITVDSVVTTTAAGGYFSSTLQLRNKTDKTLSATLSFSQFPVGTILKAPPSKAFSVAPGGLYSVYFAVARPGLNKGSVTLVYDAAGLPAKTITAKVSGCSAK